MTTPDDLVLAVTELLQLVAALGLELDGLSTSSHPFLHRVLMLHLCDRVAKVTRRVRSRLLSQLSLPDQPAAHVPGAADAVLSAQKGA